MVGLAMPLAGYFPIGGGRLEAWIEPGRPQAILADRRGALVRVHAEAGVCDLPRSIAERLIARAETQLAKRGITLDSTIVEWSGPGRGTALTLTVEHEAASASFIGLGERGKPAEVVADEAVTELLTHLDVEEAGWSTSIGLDHLSLRLLALRGRQEEYLRQLALRRAWRQQTWRDDFPRVPVDWRKSCSKMRADLRLLALVVLLIPIRTAMPT